MLGGSNAILPNYHKTQHLWLIWSAKLFQSKPSRGLNGSVFVQDCTVNSLSSILVLCQNSLSDNPETEQMKTISLASSPPTVFSCVKNADCQFLFLCSYIKKIFPSSCPTVFSCVKNVDCQILVLCSYTQNKTLMEVEAFLNNRLLAAIEVSTLSEVRFCYEYYYVIDQRASVATIVVNFCYQWSLWPTGIWLAFFRSWFCNYFELGMSASRWDLPTALPEFQVIPGCFGGWTSLRVPCLPKPCSPHVLPPSLQ